MAGRISRGWGILTQSWSVVRQDKELLLFPVLSGMACLVVTASFILPVVFVPELQETFHDVRKGEASDVQKLASLALSFAFYMAHYFVIVFFNTALASCAMIRFRGGDPTVADGLRAAISRLPQILAWAAVAATVGMILRALEERVGLLGKIVIGLIGVGWSIATYLIVPILAAERLGPIAAVRRSVALLSKTWGESLTGHISLSLVSILLILPALVVLFAGFFVSMAMESPWPVVAAGAVFVVYLIALSIVTSALQQVFLAGIYLYAAEGQVPPGFSAELLQSAFRPKKAD
jgi:hypothetical protein